MHYKTRLLHSGEAPNYNASGDVVVPIHLASTFAREEIEKPTGGYEYSRSGNPTRKTLEARLAAPEGAHYGLAFASGLAAETTLILALLKTGDHVIASDDLYGGTRRLFTKIFAEKFGLTFSYIDTTNTALVAKAINKNTKLIWLETPTNPLLKISDIRAIAKIGRARKIILVVDNTFLTPYFQRPLQLGADIALHSTTKYINGHSDSVGGAIMLSNKVLYEKIKFTQNAVGAILSPFDSYLVLRGIKTLSLRMDAHEKNARTIASFLSQQPKIKKVYYPGLANHPQHALLKEQATGFGGMISFDLKGGLPVVRRFFKKLKLFALAESLGGVKSLIEHPALMTHASIDPKTRKKIGISDGLVRMSVGLEDSRDLLADIKQALD